MTTLLIGIAIAAFVFSSFLWSFYRAVTGAGLARIAHGAVVVLILTIMAALATGWPNAVRVLGAALVVASVAAALTECFPNKLLPLFAAGLGLAALQGLPMGAP